jgi:hypothetical protein
MVKLSNDWITEKHIDFEYKKYVLLAYLQHVNENFEQTKLYPYLSDLITHYRNLVSIKENKENIYNSFPQRVSEADLQQFKIIYNKIIEDDEIMQAVESILDYSIPKFEQYLAEGRKIYDFIEEHLSISPVGISPLNAKEGYLFLQNGHKKETDVYEYQISFFENATEKYRGIHTHFLASYTRSITNTFESIKTDLIRNNKKLPNPAAYLIESDIIIPEEETLLPIAKRTLVKYLSANIPPEVS